MWLFSCQTREGCSASKSFFSFFVQGVLRATSTKGPRSRVQRNQAFLLIKSFKLVPRPLNKDPRSRQIKLWFSLHHFGGKTNWFGPKKKELKGEFMIWEHYFNSWFLWLNFLVKKFQMIGVKKIILSIWTSRFGLVNVIGYSIWTLSFWLITWLTKWLTIWLVNNELFDWVKFALKLKLFFELWFLKINN